MAETHTHEYTQKQKGKKGGMTMGVLAGVAGGALVGAAVGGVTAAALSNPRNRDKAGKLVQDVAETASEALEEAGHDAPNMPERDEEGRFVSRKR